ncbi:hypothetical protein [Lentibacillus sp. CBA3610]|uniref:hypothetical protein n=1 Tax=Lentibacillus sp. CBA3610 TaxID=2518176 RepID=UPI00159639FF|nr:hypothetical protein [Lentibacillus sp. CBA3610]
MSKNRVFAGARIKEENAAKIDELIEHLQGQTPLGSVRKQDVVDLAIEKIYEEIFPGCR